MVPSRAGARAGHSTRRHARERGGAVACRSIDPTTAAAARVRGCDLRDRIARPRARAVRRMRRLANLIVSAIARDRVVANQIIGPRARADSFFIIIIFMAEYFI